MKKHLENWDELVGKTITAVASEDDLRYLAFSDGSIAVISSERGYEGEREAPSLNEFNPESTYVADELLQAGVMTSEDHAECMAKLKASEAARRSAQEQREREQLAALQAKYGNKG